MEDVSLNCSLTFKCFLEAENENNKRGLIVPTII